MTTLLNNAVIETIGSKWGEVYLCTAPLAGDLRPRQYLYSTASVGDNDYRLFVWIEDDEVNLIIEDFTTGETLVDESDTIDIDGLVTCPIWGWVPVNQPGQRPLGDLLCSHVMKHLVENQDRIQGD